MPAYYLYSDDSNDVNNNTEKKSGQLEQFLGLICHIGSAILGFVILMNLGSAQPKIKIKFEKTLRQLPVACYLQLQSRHF